MAPLISEQEKREFMAVFPDIVRDLTDPANFINTADVTAWFSRMLQYNVPNGKKHRAMALISTYKMLVDPADVTPENMRLVYLMGWCIELLEGNLLILDDIIDQSQMRRGAPCWYRNKSVGLSGVNDAIILEQSVYAILKKYFSDLPCYVPAIHLFQDITLKTVLGESLDILSHPNGKPDLSLFTKERFDAIAKYKTAYYSFQLPVGLAMYMAGKFDPELHRQANTVLMELGIFYQVQNDYVDCFEDIQITGKESTDIQEGKCTWFIVEALQRATSKQREALETNYARSEPDAIQAVRKVYEELELHKIYFAYEKESYNQIRKHISEITEELPHDMFFTLVDNIYKLYNRPSQTVCNKC